MKINSIASMVSALAAAVCVFTSYGYTYAETKTLTLGDVNGDGLVNAVDASEVLSEYARTSTGGTPLFTDEQKLCGDIDKNGAINAIDASHILSYYAYRSTGGTLTFEEYLKGTEQPTTQPQVHIYTLENIANDSVVFRRYGANLGIELFQHQLYACDYRGETTGYNECELLIAFLNYGQIDDNVFQDVLGEYSDVDLHNFHGFLYRIAQMRKEYGARVDFTKYTLDKNVGEYINMLGEAADNGTIGDILTDLVENENIPSEVADNPAVYLALASYGKYYGAEGIFTPEDAEWYIVGEKVDEIIDIVRGRKTTKEPEVVQK